MQSRQRYVTVSTGVVPYDVVGEGPPLLWLHPSAGVVWSPLLDGLARSFQLYVPTMPGFDATPFHPAVASMDRLAALAGEFIDAAIGTACDVVGYSFGGWVAAWLAVLRPDRVHRLVLEAPAGFRPSGSPALPTGAVASPRRLANQTAPLHYITGSRNADAALAARLTEITCMTLILHGTADPLVPAESMQLLRNRLRHAYLIYIWDAGHAIEIDQPERVRSVIADFLVRGDAFIVNAGA